MIRWPDWLSFFRKPSTTDFKNRQFVEETFGIKVKDAELFKIAAIHRSSGRPENNERLELLGDAVLDMVLTDHLYRTRPEASEGYITRLRSKLVSRTQLSRLAYQIGLSQDFVYRKQHDLPDELIMGNAFEALMGAVYLDQGYETAYRVILDLVHEHVDMDELQKELVDAKSRILEWAQAERRVVKFITRPIGQQRDSGFLSEIWLDGSPYAQGEGRSKKNAEKEASSNALKRIDESH